MARNCPLSVLSFTSPYAFTRRGLPATKPHLQPVMLKLLLHECSSTPTSRAPGVERKLNGFPSKTNAAYAASWMTAILFLPANSTTRLKNPGVALAPVGLFG